jgi:CspA family cold shock protein
MPRGKVISFERNSGFGFIETEAGASVFVHHTGIADADRSYLVPGQQVEFLIQQTERGPRAEAVKVLRDVPLKAQRKLDWRHRRGGHPRGGDRPGGPPTGVEDTDEEEGILPGNRGAPSDPP